METKIHHLTSIVFFEFEKYGWAVMVFSKSGLGKVQEEGKKMKTCKVWKQWRLKREKSKKETIIRYSIAHCQIPLQRKL